MFVVYHFIGSVPRVIKVKENLKFVFKLCRLRQLWILHVPFTVYPKYCFTKELIYSMFSKKKKTHDGVRNKNQWTIFKPMLFNTLQKFHAYSNSFILDTFWLYFLLPIFMDIFYYKFLTKL